MKAALYVAVGVALGMYLFVLLLRWVFQVEYRTRLMEEQNEMLRKVLEEEGRGQGAGVGRQGESKS
jgi:hypothetical protein